MEIENTKEATVIELKNNRVFIGVYMVPLFTLIGLIISKITIYSILMCLTIFIFLNIGNYIVIRNIGSIEILILNNVSLTIRRLNRNKKITYEKKIFFGEIVKVYYQENFLGFHKRTFNFDRERNLKIKTQFSTYSFGYKMSYEDFKKINSIIEEKIKGHKNYIKKEEIEKKYIEIYNLKVEERYNYILNKIIDEEILFIAKKDNNYIVNGSYDAVEYLEVFKNIYFEEVELDSFYSYVLSKKENQDKKVLVGYNGIDGKEVTMSKFKEDINEIRDSRNIFKN